MSQTVSLEELAAFNDQLGALVRAGVPLEPGLQELAAEQNDRLGRFCGRLAERLRDGATLEEALSAERQSVPPIYRAVVSAGLESGRLPAALEAMTNLALELSNIRRQIGQSLLQPLLLAILAYVLLIVFGLDLLERYEETFFQFEMTPSPLLQWLFWAGRRLGRIWWLGLVLLALATAFWSLTGRAGLLSLSGWSRPLALIPGVSAVVRNYRYAGFSQILGLLCEHGVPLPEGLRLASATTGSRRLTDQAERLAKATERGDSQIAPGNWPRFLFWSLTSGARREGLPKLLRHASMIYRRRAQSYSLWMRTVLPIVVTVVVGGGIVLGHMLIHLGPMAALWWNLGRN